MKQRVLFVCTANVDRSRTAQDLYRDDPRYDVRSAGVASWAQRPIDADLLRWADRVFVMNEREDGHLTQIRLRFPSLERPLVDLDIEDRWHRGDPELVRRLLAALEPHLGRPQDSGGLP